MDGNNDPVIIQGGMGVAVSSWPLARAVAETGQLGVVSGTALDVVLARRLQLGDPEGHLRRALREFPFPQMVERLMDRYFRPAPLAEGTSFLPLKALSENLAQERLELIVAANFVEVFLAREGNSGLIGINYLEKIQIPTLPSLFGAMLAGVDYVLMGAGIPIGIPGVIDRLCDGMSVELPISVQGAEGGKRFFTRFDPQVFTDGSVPWLRRPKFFPIVASATLAVMLLRKSTGAVDGFIVEGSSAGGHNAPPRGPVRLSENGEPIYGERDVVDLQAMRKLGLPFWLAGAYGSPERVVEALDAGAAGVQVGTAFAFCEESGLRERIRREVIQATKKGAVDVRTDPLASPTGFPFKVLSLKDSLSESRNYENRKRRCDLGYLRQAYEKPDGSVGWRCPAEPGRAYESKGGDIDDTVGCKCVCNGLLANVGLGQFRADEGAELPLVTCGDDVKHLAQFLKTPSSTQYCARDVVEKLLSLVQSSYHVPS